MLEIESFERTNFVDGMIFNPEQIKLNDEYFINKNALLSRYGFGKGVLVGYLDNLRVAIENSQLIVHPGATIDALGNVIVVKKKTIILKDINISQFKDGTILSVYIKFHEGFNDQKPMRKDPNAKHFYKIEEGFVLELKEKMQVTSEYFELARIHINHAVSSSLKEAANPFNPIENEIDLRFTYKNYNARSVMKYNERAMVSNIMRKYADYLIELSYNKKCFSATVAASYANKLVSDVKLLNLSAEHLYEMLQHLLYVSRKIEGEIPQIINTGFWKNILRLQSLFSFNESCEVSYYDLLLNLDSSFFSKVLLHYGNASIFDGDWGEIEDKEEDKAPEIKKDYLSVGSSKDCEIVVEGVDIESEHARLYPYKDSYLIEDISYTSGVYINAVRLEAGTKRFIKHQDITTIGKHGNILNLTQIKA